METNFVGAPNFKKGTFEGRKVMMSTTRAGITYLMIIGVEGEGGGEHPPPGETREGKRKRETMSASPKNDVRKS